MGVNSVVVGLNAAGSLLEVPASRSLRRQIRCEETIVRQGRRKIGRVPGGKISARHRKFARHGQPILLSFGGVSLSAFLRTTLSEGTHEVSVVL